MLTSYTLSSRAPFDRLLAYILIATYSSADGLPFQCTVTVTDAARGFCAAFNATDSGDTCGLTTYLAATYAASDPVALHETIDAVLHAAHDLDAERPAVRLYI